MPDINQTNLSLSHGDTLLSRYRLDKVLGRGGMGTVWLAFDQLTQMQVALKLLPAALTGDKRSIARLIDEANRNLQLTHEAIVRLHAVQQDPARGGLAFLVMQYIDGQTLDDILAGHPKGFPLEKALPWFQRVAQAIDFAHGRGLLHRDIKPANIIIETKTNAAYLMDFGIAREARDTMTRVTAGAADSSGTLLYMSPQQLMGENTKSNDIYSFGITIYETLAGEPPFRTGDIAAQIRSTAPQMISSVPDAANRALARALAKQPAERPASAADLVHELAGMPIASSSRNSNPAQTPKPSDPQRRRKNMVVARIAAVAVVCVLCLAFVGMLMKGQSEQSQKQQESEYFTLFTQVDDARSRASKLTLTHAKLESLVRGAAQSERAAEEARTAGDFDKAQKSLQAALADYTSLIQLSSESSRAEDARKSLPKVPDLMDASLRPQVSAALAKAKDAQSAFDAARFAEAGSMWSDAAAVLTQSISASEKLRVAAEEARKSAPAIPSPAYTAVAKEIRQTAGDLENAGTAYREARFGEARDLWLRATANLAEPLRRHAEAKALAERARTPIPTIPAPIYSKVAADVTRLTTLYSAAEKALSEGDFDDAARDFAIASAELAGKIQAHEAARKSADAALASVPQLPEKPYFVDVALELQSAANKRAIVDADMKAGRFDEAAEALATASTRLSAAVKKHADAKATMLTQLTNARQREAAFNKAAGAATASETDAIRDEGKALLTAGADHETAGRFTDAASSYAGAERLFADAIERLRASALQRLKSLSTKATRSDAQSLLSLMLSIWPNDPQIAQARQALEQALRPVHGEQRRIDLGSDISIDFVYIDAPKVAPEGFMMGSPTSERGRQTRLDESQHLVRLSKGFWLMTTEVTQAQWRVIMDNTNNSAIKGNSLPVTNVNWGEAVDFAARLRKLGVSARLPTEAEWEFACRAGTSDPYSFGSAIDKALVVGLGLRAPQDVATRRPNGWGLFDMHGNVEEWCADWYGNYPPGTSTDPTGPSGGRERVLRGGAFNGDAADLRSADRGSLAPTGRNVALGFRVAADSLP